MEPAAVGIFCISIEADLFNLSKRKLRGLLVVSAFACTAISAPLSPALAQGSSLPAPEVLQPQLQPRITPPPRSTPFKLDGGPLAGAEPGGKTFALKRVQITGNTIFTTEKLLEPTQPFLSQQVDLAALQNLANAISEVYRQAGYPFARAYLPEQDIRDGLVKIEVLEGRLGQVTAVLAPALDPANEIQEQRNQMVEDVMRIMSAQFSPNELKTVIKEIDSLFAVRLAKAQENYAAVDAKKQPLPEAKGYAKNLAPGEVIKAADVERVALILDDMPGYVAVPVVRPGAIPGTGDLEFRMVEDNAFQFNIAYDNFGSEVSGKNRLKVDLVKARNIMFGDVFRFTGLTTNRNTSVATASYEFPLGPSGLRLNLNALQSDYKLGEQFSALNEEGDSSAYGFALSYPIVRSQAGNLRASLGYTQSSSENRGDQYTRPKRTDSRNLPLTFSFDFRDAAFGDAAVTYGALTLNHTQYDAKAHQVIGTAVPAREVTHTRTTLDIGRLQRMGNRVSAALRAATQFAPNDIDESGYFGIGGPTSIRAFPIGEVSGPTGWFSQLELRYAFSEYGATPYVFYDTGTVDKTKESGGRRDRTLSGYGIGLKYNRFGVDFDMLAAWDAEGGPSVEDDRNRTPRVWVSISKSF